MKVWQKAPAGFVIHFREPAFGPAYAAGSHNAPKV